MSREDGWVRERLARCWRRDGREDEVRMKMNRIVGEFWLPSINKPRFGRARITKFGGQWGVSGNLIPRTRVIPFLWKPVRIDEAE